MRIERIVQTGILLPALLLAACGARSPVSTPVNHAPVPISANESPLSIKPVPERIKDYIGNQLDDGAMPYLPYFGMSADSHLSGLNSIIFKNGTEQDAVVFLVKYLSIDKAYTTEELLTPKVPRHSYIRSGSSFEMSRVPNGDYFIEVLAGRDWNPDKILPNGIKGGFDRDLSFSVSDTKSDILHMNRYEDGEGIHYTTYEITLHLVAGGNMSSKSISQEGFFQNLGLLNQ